MNEETIGRDLSLPKTQKRPLKVYRNTGTEGLPGLKSAGNASRANHNQITALAYNLWKERGGSEMENWLEAEERLARQDER